MGSAGSQLSLTALLDQSIARHSRLRAMTFGGRDTSYQEFGRQIERVAAFLTARGVGKGDRIGLYSPNCDGFPAAYFAILKAGAIVVPVNVLLSVEELAHIFNDSGIRGLVFHEQFAEAAGALRSRVGSIEFALTMGNAPLPAAEWRWGQALDSGGDAARPHLDPAGDVAAIIYTSGTTGRPKGAMLTHRNLVANAASVAQALRLRHGAERVLVVLPMFHSFAGTVGMIMPLLNGCAMVILPRFEPQPVADTIAEQQATIFLGVPTMYSYLLRLPEDAAARLGSLRLCISGGAALPAAVMQAFEARYGKAIHEGDGPTECSPVTCVNPLEGPRKIGSVGVPIPGVEMRIMDAAGRELSDGAMGEICVRGPNVMKGYWQMPEATREAFFGDWFRTGDLGHRDGDGYFFIVDRLKDMVIYNGINVYPRMIEEVLYRMPAIEEAAVIGEPHPEHGEIPVAYVAFRQGQAQAEQEIIAFCQAHLGRHEVPRKIYVVGSLPRNAAGKILKRALRTQGERERGIVAG